MRLANLATSKEVIFDVKHNTVDTSVPLSLPSLTGPLMLWAAELVSVQGAGDK